MEILDIIQSFGIIGILAFLLKYTEKEWKTAVTNEEEAESKFVNAVKESTAEQVSVLREAHMAEAAIMREMLEISKAAYEKTLDLLRLELEECKVDRRQQRGALITLATRAGVKVLPEQMEPSVATFVPDYVKEGLNGKDGKEAEQ